MLFQEPREVDSLFYDLKLNDAPRGVNRALIDAIANGRPPYSPEEAAENNIEINVNYLEFTKLAQSARSSFASAFQKPGNFFECSTDMGPAHSRSKRGTIVTKEINKLMKNSLDYFECNRSSFALLTAHGIGPTAWRDHDCWCPDGVGIDDVLIPGNTLLTMRNLPFFFVYRSFTGPELIKLTRGPKVDPGWNMALVKACLEWVDKETMTLRGNQWPDIWSPEKQEERTKSDGGWYAGDAPPTIDCADFYYYHDDGKDAGWYRKIILDTWSSPTLSGGTYTMAKNSKVEFAKDQFLYDGKTRKYADDRKELIAFQFADLSAVGPFRYHSVRSLGFLLYSVCHLQNRLRCKFHESIFRDLMMLFRVKSQDDVQRALQVRLFDKGFIDETLQIIPAAERYQINTGLVELGLRDNQQIIDSNSASYTQSQNYSEGGVEKTKYQVMVESNAGTMLVSAAIQQAYTYGKFQYREIVRRFMKANSTDVDVRTFRARVLAQGVPEKLLVPEAWETEPSRIMGAGNKTLEMAQSQQLMEYRPLYDPEAQRKILRNVTMAITDDAALADDLVPEQPHVSDSIHDTELAFGALMQGSTVSPRPGLNSQEVLATMLRLMGTKIQQIAKSGGVGTPQDVQGLVLCAQYCGAFIQMLSQDKESKSLVKQFGDGLGKLMNSVKAFMQRQQEAAQAAAQNGNGAQLSPEDAAKIKGMETQAAVKAKNASQSHAEKSAQKQISFEMKSEQQKQKHEQDLAADAQRAALETQVLAAKTAAEIESLRIKSENTPTKETGAQ